MLREAGIGDELIVQHGEAPVSFDHGAQTLGMLLERAPDVEAVFAVSDIAAVGALMECHRRRIRVPEELSLIGFGDFDIGRQVVPSLTTIRVDAQLIGRRTGELLMVLLDGADAGTAPGPTIDLGFELVQRETTAEAPPRRPRKRTVRTT